MIRYCLLLSILFACTFSLMIKVQPSAEECFYSDMKEGEQVNVEWTVLAGGLLSIDIKVKYNDRLIDNRVYVEGVNENKYLIKADSSGSYGFCFNNYISKHTAKFISFQYVFHKAITSVDSKSQELKDRIKNIEAIVNKIEDNTNNYSNREISHRINIDSANSRIKWWSISETIIVLLVSIFQVYYLKRKVDRKSRSKRRV